MSATVAVDASATGDAKFILTLRCPDQPGIVHAVSGFLLRHGGNILASAQFGDPETGGSSCGSISVSATAHLTLPG